MISLVVTIAEEIKDKKRIKTKIGVESLVKEKSGIMEENTREGRSRRMRKYVMGCVHYMVEKNNSLVQFEYEQKRDMSSSSLVYVFSKEEECLEMDEPISDLPETDQGEFLTIDWDPDAEEPLIFERSIYFSVFYFCVMLRRYQWIYWRKRYW